RALVHRILAQTRCRGGRLIRGGVLALGLSGALASGAAAQADTTRRDTTAAHDSTQRDTTARDTTPALLPVFAAAIAPGPLPLGSRYTFTTDSLLFNRVRTLDRKSTRLNSSHEWISYAVFCLKK